MVLLVGDAVRPTERHGHDGQGHKDDLLPCRIIELEYLGNGGLVPIGEHINAVRQAIEWDQSQPGCHVWHHQPWHPFMLEWEVELRPTSDGHNLDPKNRAYNPHYICRNFELKEDAVNLSIRKAYRETDAAANIYSGRSILTPHANIQLKKRLESYLKDLSLDDFYRSKTESDKHFDYLKQLKTWWEPEKLSEAKPGNQELREWCEAMPVLDDDQKIKDPIYTAIQAYGKLQGLNVLAQSLGGFNQALLMRKQTLQLPVADPLGFDDYKRFTEQVATDVGKSNRSAPQPLNDFNPIRSGYLHIRRLRLVDTFGQVRELAFNAIVTTEVMASASRPKAIFLTPRLAQAARLNFRWLSASHGFKQDEDEVEVNVHPATSPVCGWFLPNNLDHSLMVYGPEGEALGSINEAGLWRHAPGRRPFEPWQIENDHLRKLVNYLLQKDLVFLEPFLNVIENALEAIDPENFAHHQALALLMGRPIAIVRASLNLELQGLPAINQDWNVFWRDMEQALSVEKGQKTRRTSDCFTDVKFPIRIGDYRQLNDGLVGYWVEKESGYEDDTFYAPQASAVLGPEEAKKLGITIHQEGKPSNIYQSIGEQPHTLTMLLDPRGVVHATSGILPTKAIRIPPDQFAEALKAIEVTFLSTPILTEAGQINLPLPAEQGYTWSWVEKKDNEWVENPKIGPTSTQATFAAPQEIREGWLKLRQDKK